MSVRQDYEKEFISIPLNTKCYFLKKDTSFSTTLYYTIYEVTKSDGPLRFSKNGPHKSGPHTK